MKKILYLLIALTLASCADLLEEVPKDRLSEANFYKTKDDAIAGLNAIYAQMRVPDAYGTTYLAQLEGMTDYAISRGSQIPVSEYQGLDGTNIGRTDNIYRILFQSINSANIIIKVAPSIPMSETDRNAILGEARFLRAFNYYNLVRNYGGVPIRTTPTEDLSNTGGKRASVDEVYQLVLEDLQSAEETLPATSAQAGRPTKWAAKTLLAEVYLTRENWAAARDKAWEVIKSGQYALVEVKSSGDFEKVFGAELVTSPEEIFYLKYARVSGQGWGYVSYLHPADAPYAVGGVKAHFTRPDLPLIKNWDKNDLRNDFNLYTSYTNRSGRVVQFPASEPISFRKYKDVSSNFAGNDYPVLRYADVLLIYAEAASQANNGPTAEGLESLNMVHRRAYGYSPSAPSPVDFSLAGQTAEIFRDLVMTERAYEFMLEGKRWHDLKRMGTDQLRAIIKQAKNKDVATAHLLWPIPKQEIDNNPDITPEDQNPGY